MTDKLEIPDPSTLEGEDLNYWCGVAAGYGMVRCKSGDTRTVPLEWWGRDWLLGLNEMWNPIENAAQCLELTPRCEVLFHGDIYSALVCDEYGGHTSTGYSQGKTELIARCRAYLASKRESDRRGE